MFIDRFCKTDFSSYEDFYANFKINVPENFNFAYDVTDVIANENPDKTALVWCDDRGGEKILSFGDMKRLSDSAAAMLSDKGIKKGDVVMTMLRGKYHYWIVALACHKLGAVLLPATYQLTEKDIRYRISAAEVSAVISIDNAELCKHILSAAEECPSVRLKMTVGEVEGFEELDCELAKYPPVFARPTGEAASKNDDLFLMYFTSGTSGMPKMVVHDYTYPLGHILTAKFWQNLGPDDLHFTSADTGWAKTSWGKFYGQWICEAAIFVYDYGTRFIPTDLLKAVSRYKVTVFCAPPTIFRFLIKEDVKSYDLSSLRHCCIAGEPLNAEVYNKWKELTGLELREGFGQTETCVLIATFPWIEAKPGSTGRPSPHFNTVLLDEYDNPVEPGDEGEVCVDMRNGKPAGITCGYYKDPEKTASIMHDGWYHTGDMAWRDEDGYLWFVGRADDVIKSSGYRIGPFEVESALIEHPAVLEAAITAVPDPERGQVVKATIVLAKGYEPSDTLKKELQDHVKRTTAPYKYPRIVEFVTEIPKTFSGKIRHAEIRSKDASK